MASLLARERLNRDAPGRFTYRSNPHRILHWQVVPTLGLGARWEGTRLEVRSTRCQLAGLGNWGETVGFQLGAALEPGEQVLTGWAEVGLASGLTTLPGARPLALLALDHVLDRIERRVGSGLRRDALAWLAGTHPAGEPLG